MELATNRITINVNTKYGKVKAISDYDVDGYSYYFKCYHNNIYIGNVYPTYNCEIDDSLFEKEIENLLENNQ